MLEEKCAVVGIITKNKSKQISRLIYNSLLALQHRGQESAGISIFDGSNIRVHKRTGLVSNVFDKTSLQNLFGSMGIGHVRYSTTGDPNTENIQPFIVEAPGRTLAIAHNGNLANYKELREELELNGHIFVSNTDSEVITHLIAVELLKSKEIDQVIPKVMKKLEGAYSITLLTSKGELIAFRDPNGFRPLSLGKLNDDTIIISSESVGFDVNGAKLERDIEPGEVVIIDNQGFRSKKVFESGNKTFCMFEYVYFARVDSIIDKKSVYKIRYNLGKNLAKIDDVDADIVVPVPDSARPAAAGYAQVSNLPLVEGLIKNRYVGRTFIMPFQKDRNSAIRLKLNPILSEIKDKRIILIDDSIVRGTTSKRIVDLLKSEGAREIHFRVTCPPIIGQCFYGIDLKSRKDLIASDKSIDEIKDEIHADSLVYQSIDGLVDAIGTKKDELCFGCLTLDYPTKTGQIISDSGKDWY